MESFLSYHLRPEIGLYDIALFEKSPPKFLHQLKHGRELPQGNSLSTALTEFMCGSPEWFDQSFTRIPKLGRSKADLELKAKLAESGKPQVDEEDFEELAASAAKLRENPAFAKAYANLIPESRLATITANIAGLKFKLRPAFLTPALPGEVGRMGVPRAVFIRHVDRISFSDAVMENTGWALMLGYAALVLEHAIPDVKYTPSIAFVEPGVFGRTLAWLSLQEDDELLAQTNAARGVIGRIAAATVRPKEELMHLVHDVRYRAGA